MSFDRFLPDFGVLPSAYFERSAITNPIELFWSDDLLSLLRLCGEGEEKTGERASDYDRFLSLCRALPLLEGHPTRAWIASVLKRHFNLRELPTEQTAPAMWKVLSDSLLNVPLLNKDIIEGEWLCDSLTLPSALPEHVTPVLDANLLLHTSARSMTAWSDEITATVARFAACGCRKIVLRLPRHFDFVAPSPYHVDQALQSAKRNREREALLICQLTRELCIAAQAQNLALVLLCEDDTSALASLLEYVEGCVGLPRICWSTRKANEAHKLLDFTAKPHKNEIFAALFYESVMTPHELSIALEAWQVRYPVGRLCFLTACDLRQMPYAQAHLAAILKKCKTKI